ncbi:MAG: ribosome small subunit-dependent GTPase A [Zetaproteobacteria bacterium]|nr:ribosome small subunit-dependent GTPase A [Pseudobdellovibrionaceae bacterium]
MKSWKNKNWDKFSKKEKIYKQAKKKDQGSKTDQTFILTSKQWEEKILSGLFPARVVEVQKKYIFVAPENLSGKIKTKDVRIATVAKKHTQIYRKERNFVVVGDRVLCQSAVINENIGSDLPQCSLEYRLSRENKLSRIDPLLASREHVLASNVDQLVIVASYLHPRVKWGLIDRYLIVAEHENIKPIIILNKKDLLDGLEKESFVKDCINMESLYTKLGYEVHSFQADKRKISKEEKLKLKSIFSKKISMLSGHSGVGKSSIVNLLGPEIIQDVETDAILTKGRHTTTFASFLKLKIGGYVIDTPGIRSFKVETNDPFSLSWGFVEMRPYIEKCKYRTCRHERGDECKVVEALDQGLISERRYQSYLGLLLGTSGREGRMSVQMTE